MKYDFDFWLKWGSTFILIVATIAASVNFLPWNRILGLLGSIGWSYAAWRMDEKSLFVVNLVTSLIYLIGFFIVGV